MGGINLSRCFLGGLVAGIVIWILEGVASVFYMDQMTASMERHGLTMEMSASVFAWSVVVSLITGLVIVFFYALSRPRMGAGPKTAVIVAAALWLGGYFVSVVAYHLLGLFPGSMLVVWGAVGLVEMILAGLLGAAIYREA